MAGLLLRRHRHDLHHLTCALVQPQRDVLQMPGVCSRCNWLGPLWGHSVGHHAAGVSNWRCGVLSAKGVLIISPQHVSHLMGDDPRWILDVPVEFVSVASSRANQNDVLRMCGVEIQIHLDGHPSITEGSLELAGPQRLDLLLPYSSARPQLFGCDPSRDQLDPETNRDPLGVHAERIFHRPPEAPGLHPVADIYRVCGAQHKEAT